MTTIESRPEDYVPVADRLAVLSGLRAVAAGSVPLVPYVFPAMATNLFAASTVLSLIVLFGVGAARARVGTGSWWLNGLEMLVLGIVVGAVAYYGGAIVAALVDVPIAQSGREFSSGGAEIVRILRRSE